MQPGTKKTWTRLLGEGALALIVVMAAFIFILLGIKHRFPEVSLAGLGLGSPEAPPAAKVEAPVAHLGSVRNGVRSRRSNEVAWADAADGLSLFERDSVQTLKRAGAVVHFGGNQKMSMDENALVIIQGLRQEKKQKRSRIEVVDGSFQSQMDGSAGDEAMEVTTPTATVFVEAADAQLSDFRVDVNPDKTSNVMVYRGTAKVSAQGVTVEVRENEGTHIGHDAPPESPRPLIAPVVLEVPPDGGKDVHDDAPPDVRFVWKPQERAAAYRVQVSPNATFTERVVDRVVTGSAFSEQGLTKGNYYWRVAAQDAAHIEGLWSEARQLDVVQPALRIVYPDADRTINQETLWVEGESELDAAVYLNGEKIALDDVGRFSKEIPLHIGENMVVLEAIDASGASRFQKRLIRRES